MVDSASARARFPFVFSALGRIESKAGDILLKAAVGANAKSRDDFKQAVKTSSEFWVGFGVDEKARSFQICLLSGSDGNADLVDLAVDAQTSRLWLRIDGAKLPESMPLVSNLRRIYFFDRNAPRFPVMAIDSALTRGPGDAGVDVRPNINWTRRSYPGGDSYIGFSVDVRCALAPLNFFSLPPWIPERVRLYGLISFKDQLKEPAPPTPRVRWGVESPLSAPAAFKKVAGKWISAAAKAGASAAPEERGLSLHEIAVRYEASGKGEPTPRRDTTEWKERTYKPGDDVNLHLLPLPLSSVLRHLDPEAWKPTGDDPLSRWSRLWLPKSGQYKPGLSVTPGHTTLRVAIVEGPRWSARGDLTRTGHVEGDLGVLGDCDLLCSRADTPTYELQFEAQAHGEAASENVLVAIGKKEPPGNAPGELDCGGEPYALTLPNFPHQVDFRISQGNRSGAEPKCEPPDSAPLTRGEHSYMLVQRQPPFWGSTKQLTAAADAKADAAVIPWIVAVDRVDPRFVIRIWNAVADRYVASVRTIRADRPISLYPRLQYSSRQKEDGTTEDGTKDDALFTLLFRYWDSTYYGQDEKLAFRHRVALWRIEPGTLGNLYRGREACELAASAPLFRAEAELPLFRDIEGHPLRFPVQMQTRAAASLTGDADWRLELLQKIAGLAPRARAKRSAEDDRIKLIDLALHQREPNAKEDKAPPPAHFGLGAYALTLGRRDPSRDVNDESTQFSLSFDSDWRAAHAFADAELNSRDSDPRDLQARFRFKLSLAAFAPSGQDRSPEEPANSARPVLVALAGAPPAERGDSSVGPTPDLFLDVEESSHADSEAPAPQRAQRVRLTVSTPAQSTPASELLVLDTEPFFVAKVRLPALAPSNEKSAIAVWESDGEDGPYWRIAADETGYSLVLPPQAIGESAIKDKRSALEGKRADDPQVNDSAFADFRFSPPATIQVFTSWREGKAGVVEPPFNTRRIFGFASQRAPGAPLRDASFELLYGLGASVSGAAQGVASSRLVTELAADLGLLAPAIPQDSEPDWGADFHQDPRERLKWARNPDAAYLDELRRVYDRQRRARYDAFREDWRRVRLAFQRRLAVLSVQDRITGVNAAFVEGVGFKLRESAQIRSPVRPIPTEGKSPYRKGGPRERDDNAEAQSTLLDGGVDWGLESTNIFNEIWRTPTADGGEVAQLHFSALGAWGRQKALFAQRKSQFVSQTGQGRTHFYSVIRIGRIGVFWNHAKHVIVYRRSVRASSQFKVEQPANEGRPFLRKVLEYVELLQPERAFPEDGVTPIRRGFVERIVFRTKIILVDSKWGEDIPGGWKIPLWSPLADPSIYPKPQVELKLAQAPDVEKEAGPAFAAIAEPQNLVFFTSTDSNDTDRTDDWPSVHGVDFVNLPPPTPGTPDPNDAKKIVPFLPTHRDKDADAILPPDRPIPAGFEPVTFVLERNSGRSANLAAERSASQPGGNQQKTAGMTAVLDTVTLMRRTALTEKQLKDQLLDNDAAKAILGDDPDAKANLLGAARQLGATMHEKIAGVRAGLEQAKVELERATQGDKIKQDIRNRIKELAGVEVNKWLPPEQATRLKNIADTLSKDPCKAFSKAANREIADAAKRAQSWIGNLTKPLRQDVANWAERARKIAGDSPKATIEDIRARIVDLQSAVDRGFDQFQLSLDAVKKTVSSPVERIARAAPKETELIELVKNVFKRLRGQLDACSTAVAAAIVAGQAQIDRARFASDLRDVALRLLADYDSARSALVETVRKVTPGLAASLDKTVGGTRSALQNALRPLLLAPQRVKDLGDQAFGDVNTFAKDAFAAAAHGLAAAEQATDRLVADIGKQIAELDKQFSEALKNTSPVIANIESISAKLTAAKDKFDEVLKQAAAKSNLADVQSQLLSAIQSVEDRAVKAIDEAEAELKALADKPEENAKDYLSSIEGACKKLTDAFKTPLDTLAGDLGNLGVNLETRLGSALQQLDADINKGIDALDVELDNIQRGFHSIERAVAGVAAQALVNIKGFEDQALRVLAAFGDPPKVPGLQFNREKIAYYFNEALPHIDTTPVAALFDRLGKDLKGVGLRVPMQSLSEKLLPKFENFKLGELFPDIGGIKLDKLFPSLSVPSGASDKVIVTHGLDKEHRKAWIDAQVKPLDVANSAPIFSFAGLAVSLDKGKFTAHARIEANEKGALDRSSDGRIDGDWRVAFGSTEIVKFKDTPIRFDKSGHLNIDFKAKNIQLSPELSFLDTFLSAYPSGGSKSPVRVGVIQDGLIPSGVECVIDLAIPPMQYGTFGVTGLRFIGGMQIRAYPDFSITVHAALGAVTTPFTITVFILGGTGWVQTWGRYTPRTNELVAHATLAIGVSAQVGFSFGVINGLVQLVIGIKGDMETSSLGGGYLAISVFMLVNGTVDVAGLITAALMLLLELRFEDGGVISAEGTAMFSIRLGPFYTFRVAQHVTYRLTGSGPARHKDPAAGDIDKAANEHASALA